MIMSAGANLNNVNNRIFFNNNQKPQAIKQNVASAGSSVGRTVQKESENSTNMKITSNTKLPVTVNGKQYTLNVSFIMGDVRKEGDTIITNKNSLVVFQYNGQTITIKSNNKVKLKDIAEQLLKKLKNSLYDKIKKQPDINFINGGIRA